MPDANDLHGRLDALGEKLKVAREALAAKNMLRDGHHLSSGELMARHAFLKSEVDVEMVDLESHGYHVSALEQDMMIWLASVDLEI